MAKLYAIDMPEKFANAAEQHGFELSTYTLGSYYKAQPVGDFVELVYDDSLQHADEFDILFYHAKMGPGSRYTEPLECGPGAPHWRQRANKGWISVAPLVAARHRERILKAVKNGSVCVIFAEILANGEYGHGFIDHYGRFKNSNDTTLSLCNADIAIPFSQDWILHAQKDGREITFLDSPWNLLDQSRDGMFYTNIFSLSYQSHIESGDFRVLAKSKFGDAVGVEITVEKGRVIILPTHEDITHLASKVLSEVLPHVCPTLYGGTSIQGWAHSRPYASGEVLQLESVLTEYLDSVEKKVDEMQETIDAKRRQLQHEVDILTTQGDQLVAAVVKCMHACGLVDFCECDSDRMERGLNLAEDAEDFSMDPPLIAEVKGLSGFPADGDVMQLVKHLFRRSRDDSRTDIRGLLVVNQQMAIPPLDRAEEVFTSDRIYDAAEAGICLLTTWQLRLIMEAARQYCWTPAMVRGIFERPGLCTPLPPCFVRGGNINHYYPQPSVLSIDLDCDLSINDAAGIILKSEIVSFPILSIQVDGQAVGEARAGQRAGVHVEIAPELCRQMQNLPFYIRPHDTGDEPTRL